jgi:hypothetical protein
LLFKNSSVPAAKLNTVQLMLLGAEGVAVCCICVVWMVILLQRVAVQRYSMFSVFMVGGSKDVVCRQAGRCPAILILLSAQGSKHM